MAFGATNGWGRATRARASMYLRTAFLRMRDADLLPATIPNTSVPTLFDRLCKLRVVLASLSLRNAAAPTEGEAAPTEDERGGLSEAHSNQAPA